MNKGTKIIVNHGPSITVDPDMYAWLQTMTWYQTTEGARVRLEDGSYQLLHRIVAGNPVGLCVGFRDKDRTNCRRKNLFVFPPGCGLRVRRQLQGEEERQRAALGPHAPIALPVSDGTTVLIDKDQYERFKDREWHRQWGLAFCYVPGGKTAFLHREIMGYPRGLCVGFIDKDKSNCQRSNLFTHLVGEGKVTRKLILERKLGQIPEEEGFVDEEPTS